MWWSREDGTMSIVPTLARLQRIDQQFDAKKRRVGEIEATLSDDAVLDSARVELETLVKSASDQRARLREHELKAASLDAKIRELEARLFSGQVTNPKELDGYARDQAMHKRLRGGLDGQILELMDAVDAAQKQVDRAKEQVARLESERGAHVEEIGKEKQELEEELRELEGERRELRGQLNAKLLATYDQLFKNKAGQALARLRQGVCGACGVSVPSGLAARARQGEELVFCPNCGRILSA
jgi:predicted  nucleic acid-binding Zn-ribbon protein